MAAITASMVAELRAKTDAPMMECKKALTEADGDMAKAEELLRVKLGTKAGKAASRVTAEGVVAASISGNLGALIEVNSETDFVSKNDSFIAMANAAAKLVAEHNPANIEALGQLAYEQDGFGPTLEDACNVLGVKTTDDATTIKRAYRKLMSEHHPDKLVAKGLPPEMMEMAKQKAQEIQKSYELIKDQKGFK